jgi:hypothetical protein
MSLRPPAVKADWDDNDVWSQAQLLAYSQVRDLEEAEDHLADQKFQAQVAGAKPV